MRTRAESAHERKPAEDEPSLIAVPNGRDRVHDEVARIPIGREFVENADAQIEAIQENVKEDADAKHERPCGDKIYNGLAHGRVPASVEGSAWIGRAGRPLSIGSGSVASSAGPSRMILIISARPAENMTR